MNVPACLSQGFVNKQNVRSFGNILNSKILRKDDVSFLQYVFEDNYLVSVLSDTYFLSIFSELKTNLRNSSIDDFKKYFTLIEKPKGTLASIQKEHIFECCWRGLNEIIPRKFFGSNHNNRIFKKFVQAAIYSMKRQHTSLKKFIEKWNTSTTIWKYLGKAANEILLKTLLWILKYIVSPMICLNFYVTTCKLDTNENKLHYFIKSQWQRFYDKKVANLIFCKILRKHEPYYVSKKMRRNCSENGKKKLKAIKKMIPKLYLVLKLNNDCRPIVRYKTEQVSTEKYKIKEKLNFLKALTGKPTKKFETEFNRIYNEWIQHGRPKLYFVKTDLSNAFGLINREKLMKIVYDRYSNLQLLEKNPYMKKKFAQQYKDLMMELRRPLLVRTGNTVFEWTEGLVQGYKYSPALSELYYSYLDDIYFSEHFKHSECKICLFKRVVDDYLYITDSLKDAELFLEALSRYRNVNYDKTVVNFPHEKIKSSDEITFLGYSYNTNKMEVSRASNVFTGQMCYKIAFTSSIVNLNKFLENRIGQSGIQINGHIFNFFYNPEELIWRHIFTTFCLSANKFCTILVVCESILTREEILKYVLLYKRRVSVKLSNSMIETLMRNKPKDFMFMYCINHFRYLSFKALYLCAAQTSKCSGLVPIIMDEMAKSNCIFGKWKEHGCRIETDGGIRRSAVREICTRNDLRMLIKSFDTLPEGFQCYNHRKPDL